MKLTYKIVYAPDAEDYTKVTDKDINFLCSDSKLHIRLRDYNTEEVIHGFINKLTYLITYLFQRNINTNDIDNFVNNDSSIKQLNSWLESLFYSLDKNYKGLKILQNYRKIKLTQPTPCGGFSKGACPLMDGITYGDISFFNNKLTVVNLETFLLNDAIDLVITKDTSRDSYKKFTNKVKRVKKNTLEYIPLF